MLRSERPLNIPLTVDFASFKVDSPVLLPKLHSLVFDSDTGSHALDMFARQMGRLSAKQGRLPSFLRFLHRASFKKSTYFRFILDKDQYEEFLEEQRQLYIQKISPAMGSSFSVAPGVFRQSFEDMEIKTWTISDKTYLYNVGHKIQDIKIFLWRVLKDKRLKIRSFLADLSNVDTRSSQVDTRPSFQQISLPDWDSRSTLDQVRSTHSG
ncbi:hypothetical protein Taro_033771 [Colocasia esculenta]|uniref:Uncharacterized protein n=1 Tax=Colocasia esculenta TaxID=4460 RepID=A0A843VW26_COLES|nr:hypothetical protein [Colocasia esculenta]